MIKRYPAKQTRRVNYKGLPVIFKSKAEAAVADYLELLILGNEIKDYAYEPQDFVFNDDKLWRLKRYRPDFRVDIDRNNHYWIEVKGYLDTDSVTKLRRFAKYYPKERIELWMDGIPAGRTKSSRKQLRRIERVTPYVARVVNARHVLHAVGLI